MAARTSDSSKSKRSWALACGAGALALVAWAVVANRTQLQSQIEPGSGRSYRVMLRADHDSQRPAPVLFLLHAYGTPPDSMLRGYWLRLLGVVRRDLILVLPHGQSDRSDNPFWNASQACCAAQAERKPDDLAYLRGVLADVQRVHAVDPHRVWALGVSNGGFMAYRWACTPDSPLTAFASISGAGQGSDDPPCRPGRALRVLALHGEADEVVTYAGGRMNGVAHPSARASLGPFLSAAGLRGAPRVSRVHSLWAGSMRKEEWSSAEAHIALWSVPGGPHHLRAAQLALPDILAFLAGD